MNGGTWEYTMGNYGGYTGKKYATNGGYERYTSGFNGLYADGGERTDGISMPDRMYYDYYITENYSERPTKEVAILGDATWETMGWYSDYNYGVEPAYPWLVRGATASYTKNQSGVFAINGNQGEGYRNNSFRVVLIP